MNALGRFAALLQRAPLELNAEDIADALWLATLTGPVELRRAPSVPDPSHSIAPVDPSSSTGPGPMASVPPPAPPIHPGTAEAVLPAERVAVASVPFRSPTAAAIPDALALGRALRPLRRRVPSPTQTVLDENATATFIADTSGRLWLPVLQPARSRWLDLELVVEDSPSMRLWSRTIAELELLFQFNGAFRNIYPWRLASDGPIRLSSGRDQSTAVVRDHRELFDSSGRRAIVIVSDCVSAAWYGGTLRAWLAAWARRSPVAVLQVLPQRLWTRTALRRGFPTMFSAATPAVPNRRLSPRYIAGTPAPGDDVIALPVMTLEATSVAAWARTVAGLSGTIEGVALPSSSRQASGVARIASAAPTAAARVARFRETSTAPAKLLASCLAAVPINLPIVRLVRAAAVPEARDSDLAELFLGGLLREVAADDDPDRVEYDFHDGVRELLLDFVPTGKALYVLDRVSAYIEPRIGQTRDFPARLTEVTEAGATFAQRHRSFAVLAARVFDRLGDDWSDAAARLQQHAGSPLPGRDVGAAAFTRFFHEKAAEYEQIRRQQPAGRERTAILDALIDDVVRHVQRHAVAPGDILALYATGQDGVRVVALGGCVGAPHAVLVTTISDAIGTPRSRFELWWALQAARAAINKLGALRAEPCVAATLDQLMTPNRFLNQRPHGGSTRLAEAVIDEFQREIGLSSARFWIEAGAGRQGTGRCVAILGSDPPGNHLAFSRALGARLAAHGWKVVAGRGDNVGPEVIKSFVAAGGPAGEGTLYSSKMFDSNDSMRRYMIASADAAVLISGGDGTAVERGIARREGIPVVAIGFTGGTAAQTTADLLHAAKERDHLAELVRLLDTPRDPSISAEIAVRLLHLEVRNRPKASTRHNAFKLHDAEPTTDTALEMTISARRPATPTPAYDSEAVRALSERLQNARQRKQALYIAGVATDEVDREILEVRRRLRDGFQLRAGADLENGRYVLIKTLGRGGFAVVWEAYDIKEGQRVAIKVLHSHLADDAQRRERFFRGAKRMMELDHPGVVRVLDPHGEDDAFCYFVMELVPGGTLRDAVLAKRVESKHVLTLVLQVGDTLAEAHRRQLVHRDIKPANILLDEHGNAKLTDFDLVGAHDTTGGTRTGALGTVVYSAPECLLEPQGATARADVFGLGMTTIFCLYGQDLSLSTFRDPESTLARLSCSLPVRKVLARAVAWEPDHRFADAGAMMVALRRAMEASDQRVPVEDAPSMPAAPPQVDIGILTVRDEEFRAVLEMFPTEAGTAPGAHREYALRYADAGNGEHYTITVLRQRERGAGEAQIVARELIEDLEPRLILVVGIAGGLPSDDITLGDVVLSTRIHDFTVEARKAGHEVTYATTGGPIDRALANVVADLASREDVLGNWTADLPARPPVAWTRKGQLEGSPEWQRELRAKLEHHHGKGTTRRTPVYTAGPIASSDRLVKDPAVLIPWLTTAHNLLAVEMESGGVYRAVRERCPMLAIRGISDIVGLKRSDAWTKYACASAAAFTRAFLRTRPIELTAAVGNAMESLHARSTADPIQPRHDQHVASPQTGETRMTADDLLNLLSKLLPSQFEAVLFRAKVPIEYLPATTVPQTERAIATIRYFELQSRLDQLARTIQQVVTGGEQVSTDPR